MTEEYLEEYLEEDSSEGSSSNRPFVITAGILGLIGLISIACIVIVLLTRGQGNGATSDEIAQIETRNAEIALTNEAVTMTIIAMETEAARPTNTPTNTPTSTATTLPTNTPQPTDTPVVPQTEVAEATSQTFPGTSVFSAGSGDSTPTPISAVGSGGNGSLPQTGISTWTATIAALVFLAVLIAARRLRNS